MQTIAQKYLLQPQGGSIRTLDLLFLAVALDLCACSPGG